MKALFINETCGRGSHGQICTSLMDILHSQGDVTRIAYGRGTAPKAYRANSIQIGSKFGVYLHAIGSRLFDNTGFYSGHATQKLICQIKEFDPDIIHLHNIHGYYIHIGVLFRYLSNCGKKVIWTLHDSWAYTGHCTCSDYIGCEKWKTGCASCPQKHNYPASVFLDRSAKNYEVKKRLFTSVEGLHLVVPSEWMKSNVEESFLKKYPVTVIRSGIDLTVFHPTESSFRAVHHLEGKRILLAVANAWSSRKGLDTLNKLADVLDDGTYLVLVGNLRKERVHKRILTIDHTSNQLELAEIYAAADVYLNLSYEESQGLTTIEALACGTPAVVSNRTAIPESVDASCGVVVDVNSMESVLKGIEKAMLIKPENCVHFASFYGKRECFMNYIALYQEVLQ